MAYHVCPIVHGYACRWSLLHAHARQPAASAPDRAGTVGGSQGPARAHLVHCPAAGMSSAEERSRGGVCTRLVAMAASVRGEPAGRASEGDL